ncbi:MAG: hypothetical protein C00003105_01574 [ANME-2 cluster archaeon HR1]|nr:MAG: hypothetical protein C00003105_01574 [ANME-2 cluster archaeon HR1]
MSLVALPVDSVPALPAVYVSYRYVFSTPLSMIRLHFDPTPSSSHLEEPIPFSISPSSIISSSSTPIWFSNLPINADRSFWIFSALIEGQNVLSRISAIALGLSRTSISLVSILTPPILLSASLAASCPIWKKSIFRLREISNSNAVDSSLPSPALQSKKPSILVESSCTSTPLELRIP